MSFPIFILLVIYFIACLISPKFSKSMDETPGITWFGKWAKEKEKKNHKHGYNNDFFREKGREWMDRDSWKDIDWGDK